MVKINRAFFNLGNVGKILAQKLLIKCWGNHINWYQPAGIHSLCFQASRTMQNLPIGVGGSSTPMTPRELSDFDDIATALVSTLKKKLSFLLRDCRRGQISSGR